jgi:Mrp family chromosome partitioning ATPase
MPVYAGSGIAQMSKIFEALEHARREAVTHDEPPDYDFINENHPEFVEPKVPVEPEPVEQGAILDLYREPALPETEQAETFEDDTVSREPHPPMDYHFEVDNAIFALYQRIDAILPLNTRRIIQFIGPQGEEDISSIARGFAYVAVKSGKSVLLIEGDQKNHHQKQFFDIKTTASWMDTVNNSKVIPEAIHQIGNIPLYVSTNVDGHIKPQQIALPKAFKAFVESAGDAYDLLVVDSSPAQKTNDGLLLSPMMDGIVLIVEANRTLGNTAEDFKNRILSSGGNLLGVVVSRERHYLPGLLAKRVLPRQGK